MATAAAHGFGLIPHPGWHGERSSTSTSSWWRVLGETYLLTSLPSHLALILWFFLSHRKMARRRPKKFMVRFPPWPWKGLVHIGVGLGPGVYSGSSDRLLAAANLFREMNDIASASSLLTKAARYGQSALHTLPLPFTVNSSLLVARGPSATHSLQGSGGYRPRQSWRNPPAGLSHRCCKALPCAALPCCFSGSLRLPDPFARRNLSLAIPSLTLLNPP